MCAFDFDHRAYRYFTVQYTSYLITDHFSESLTLKNRRRHFLFCSRTQALIGIAYSVGFIVGPQIGSIFSRSLRELKPEALTVDVERKVLFWQPALCSVALTGLEMVAIWCLPETSKPGARVAGPAGSRDSFRRAVNLVNPIGLFRFEAVRFPTPVMRSRAVQMGLINAAYLFIFSGVESSLTLLTATRFNYDRCCPQCFLSPFHNTSKYTGSITYSSLIVPIAFALNANRK